jgi:hypothetical protein
VQNNTLVIVEESITGEGEHSFSVKCADGELEGSDSVTFYLNITGEGEPGVNDTQPGEEPGEPGGEPGTEPNATNISEEPPEDYWSVTGTRGPVERILNSLGANRLSLFVLILLLIIIIALIIKFYSRVQKVQKEIKKTEVKVKDTHDKERCEKLKAKRKNLEKKLSGLKKRTKGYKACKKELEGVQEEMLKNDVYLMELYEKAKHSLARNKKGVSTATIKKQLKKEGYTAKELKVIKRVFAEEKLKGK